MKYYAAATTSVIALLAQPAMSFGQSTVTLYGIIDTSAQWQQGMPQGHSYSLASGNWLPSRWGIKGQDDIGGGTRVVFQLESGFSSVTGSLGCGIFCRRATVGLTNPTWGTVNIGRIGVDELQEDSWFVDPQVFMLFGLSTMVRGRNWTFASNSIEYTSPTWYGVTLKGQYELTSSATWNAGNPGSGPGQLNGPQGRSDGIELTYSNGPLGLQAIYDEIRSPYGTFNNVYQNSRSLLLGGNYTIGHVTLYAGFQHLSAPQASINGYFTDAGAVATSLPGGASLPTAVNHEWFGASWQITPVTVLTAAYYHANANNGNGNANLYTLAAAHALSKSVTVYSEVGLVTNSKASNIGLGDGYSDPYGANVNNNPSGGAADFRTSPDYGHSQTSVIAGVIKRF